MSRRLREALFDLRHAEIKLERVLHEEYPVGEAVRWAFGEGEDMQVYEGVVVSHGSEQRIQVRNRETGGVRWIVAAYIRS